MLFLLLCRFYFTFVDWNDASALVASASDDVSQLELMMVENEIKEINTSQKAL